MEYDKQEIFDQLNNKALDYLEALTKDDVVEEKDELNSNH